MSYSFAVRAAAIAAVADLVSAEYDTIVTGQPVHANDRDEAEAAVASLVGTLDSDEDCDVLVTVSGSVSTTDGNVRSVSLSVIASLVARVPEAAPESGGGGHGIPPS